MKSLVLLSGGIDSAVCLAMLRGQERAAISFDYGQRHRIELQSAVRFAASEDVELHHQKLPQLRRIDDVVFAGRNALMLTAAAALAQANRYDYVVIGCNRDDAERFPDCRAKFLDALGGALNWAYDVDINAPLLSLSKKQVIERARTLGLDLGSLWTCYAPVADEPCGACYACIVRTAAEAEAMA